MPVFSRELGGLVAGICVRYSRSILYFEFLGNIFSGQMIQKGIAPSVIGVATGCLSALCLAALSYFSSSILIFVLTLMLMGFLIDGFPQYVLYGWKANSRPHIFLSIRPDVSDSGNGDVMWSITYW